MSGVSLLRHEVMDARREPWLGSIIVAVPLSRQLFMLTSSAVTLAATVLLFLVFGYYTRRETVTGQLVLSAGLLTIVASSAGSASNLHVHDDEQVKVDEVLMEQSDVQDSAAFSGTYALVGRQLDAQRTHPQADVANQQQLAQQAEALCSKIAPSQSLLNRIGSQLDIAQKQVAMLEHIQGMEG